MGYFSELAIDQYIEEREPGYPTRRDTLQYYLEDLEAKLEEIEEKRPHDPMDPFYDRYFYSNCIVHYYENPSTVQDILFCLREVTELLHELDEEETLPVTEVVDQLPGQQSLLDDDYLESYRAA